MKLHFKKRYILYWIFSILMQLLFLPTLCGEGVNNAKFIIAIFIDILIPMRLVFKHSKAETTIYLTILFTSFIWINIFINILMNFTKS